MPKKVHHSYSWQICVLCLAAVFLVCCSNPAPAMVVVTKVKIPSTTAVTTRISMKTPTPQIPIPTLDSIIPRPVSVAATGGTFILSARTAILVDPATDELKAIGEYLAEALNPATGYDLKIQDTQAAPTQGSITLALDGTDPALGEEGYELTITPNLVRLVANQPAGLFHGVQTIRQLLPAAINNSSVQPGPWVMGTGTITDYPRFAWRGAMLDVARHFFNVKEVTRYIDLLAYYKLNRLHLHLTDDQGWRIQIKSWPRLALSGGSLEVGGTPGGYYSQEDYAALVDYARSRYITIIPEIDMPAHINAALVAYPELTCDGVTPQPYIGTGASGSSICTSGDVTRAFLEEVIAELAALTPGGYIHIGGDEATTIDQPEYIRFVRQVQSIVMSNGKHVIGWEEVAQAQLLPSSILQLWNPDQNIAGQAVQAAVKQAVGQGAQVILSPANKTYLDMKYQASTTLGQTWAGIINLETAYSWDPATLIDGINEKTILGVEAPLWSETLKSMDDLEYMAFPRLAGIAEIGWTPQSRRDWNEYKIRLATHGPRLEALGVHFYPAPEIAWP